MLWKRNKSPDARQRLGPRPQRQAGAYSSYYSGNPNNRPLREKPRYSAKQMVRLRLLPTILAVTVIVFSLLYSLTLASSPLIETSNGQLSVYRHHDEYTAEAERLIGLSSDNQSKLSIKTAEIEQGMLERFPELRSASLRLPVIGRRMSMTLDLRQPALILATSGKSFILDRTGRAVSELQDVPSEARANLPLIKDESGMELSVGKQVITTETVTFIGHVTAQLDNKSLKVTDMRLPAAANQLNLGFENLPYYVKTDISGDARLQIGRFIAVKEDLSRKGITPAEYIDVRVEEKVFYK